ncbi:unnamed protein product [Moneuplotes crassus]|uniref:Uncharacterized protein n=2 Tax=Euplotes crassus TaxID=5936 RepID=A0AAD2D8W1_EUPCR|nr:unnamed protein product [Moneuplotes crassus]
MSNHFEYKIKLEPRNEPQPPTIEVYGFTGIEDDGSEVAINLNYKLLGEINLEEYKCPEDSEILAITSLESTPASQDLLNLKSPPNSQNNLLIFYISNNSNFERVFIITTCISSGYFSHEEVHSFSTKILCLFPYSTCLTQVALCAYIETYSIDKFTQKRMIICIGYEDTIFEYILTTKEWRIFVNEYSYMTQVSYIQQLIPTYNPDGEGTFIVMVFKNLTQHLAPLNCSCIRLIPKDKPAIEPTTFNLTSIEAPINVLGFNDNIVIQTKSELIIFNLTKERDLIIPLKQDDHPEQLVDVYIDTKSRIYAASWHKILFVSLKKQSFEIVYEREDVVISSILHISESFCAFRNTFENIQILEVKSKNDFSHTKTVEADVLPSIYKFTVPELAVKIYDFTVNSDLIIKRRETRNLTLPYKILGYKTYPDGKYRFCLFIGRLVQDNTLWLLCYDHTGHKIIHQCQLPNFYNPVSLCFSPNRDKVIILASRQGEQDLNPTDSDDFATVPFQDHLVYYVNIERFKVRMDGKLTKHMYMSLNKIKNIDATPSQGCLPIFTTLMCHIKDGVYAVAVGDTVNFYTLNDDFKRVCEVPEIVVSDSEANILLKDNQPGDSRVGQASSNLLKEEILSLEKYDLLDKEVIRAIKVFRDSVDTLNSKYFLIIVSNMKVYLYQISLPQNDFMASPLFELFADAKPDEIESITHLFIGSIRINTSCDPDKVRILPVSKDRVVLHCQQGQIWQLSIKRKLDFYCKAVEFSINKEVLWSRPQKDKRAFLDLHNNKGNDFECRLLLQGVIDFIPLKLAK